jgi:hypothetical protein
MTKVEQLAASLRAHRRRWRHPLLLRTDHTRGLQRRPGGHGTNRPGDRLHRALNGGARAGDAEYLAEVLEACAASRGDVPAIAEEFGIGERTFRGWMMKHSRIRSAVKVALLAEQLRREKAYGYA